MSKPVCPKKRTAHFHLSFRFNLDMVGKNFLLRAKQKGVDVDTGIVTGKLNKKRLDPSLMIYE